MDTILFGQICHIGSFMDTFSAQQNCHIWQFYGHFSVVWAKIPTKLRTLAVLWTLFGCLSPSSCMVPQNCHIWQFYGHFTKLPYMAVVPKWLRDKIKRFQSSSFRNIYEMNPFFFSLLIVFVKGWIIWSQYWRLRLTLTIPKRWTL